MFGCYRFKNYQVFAQRHLGVNNASKVARTLLMKWFNSKGFSSFESFRPVVQTIYPEITTGALLGFWEGDFISELVLERVNHVYQILS
jgi:hypothetical protein